MAELAFQDLKFEENGTKIVVNFLDSFYFEVEKVALKDFEVHGSRLLYRGMAESEARHKFNNILDIGFQHLASKVTGKPVAYINRYFGLPLIGSAAFGIVDRNSNMLEIKPVTGCNMNCIFCSVDEGLATRKVSEIVIDKDYLVEEAAKVIAAKDCEVHITINAHGEPTTYRPMPELIRDLAKIKNVKTISLITNGTLLSEEYIDRLASSGLTRLNISLNAVSERMAKILEGHGRYDVKHVMKMAEYAAKMLEVVLAPVFVPDYNDAELNEIVMFAKRIGAKVGIQNYLFYRRGRSPKNSEQMPWEKFYEMLKELESETGFKLILDEKDFHVVKTKPLPKPFRKGQVVDAEIKCPGRYRNECIAASKGRSITLMNCAFNGSSKARILITGDKHNIFYGKVM